MELLLVYLWLQAHTIAASFALVGIALLVYCFIMWINHGETYKKINIFTKEEYQNLLEKAFEGKQRYVSVYSAIDMLEKVLYCPVSTWSVIKTKMYAGAICIGLALMLPSKTDVAILVGSSIALDVVKSPEGQKIGTLIRGKANELLDAEISKLSKGK